MKALKTAALAVAIILPGAQAMATSYSYVGSWNVAYGDYDNDPLGLVWTLNPQVYTGQEAAAFLFGGDASDYVISTVSDNVADINFKTWLDGWADGYTYAGSGIPADQDFSYDSTGLGYNGCELAGTDCVYSAYSALIIDHLVGGNFVNYAFRVSDVGPAPVPVPAAGLLLTAAIGGLAVLRRRKA